jgi:hypothetical protein
MLPRPCLAALLGLLVACGGAENDGVFDPVTGQSGAGMATAGASDAGSTATGGGGTGTAGAGGTPGAPSAGAGGSATTAGMTGSAGATAGQPGASGGGSGSGGAGGTSNGSAGHAGTAQAGAGGNTTDPLAPKPLAGCPGYVKVFVPKGTCVWLHGTAITHQTETCSLVNPAEGKCGTASAVSGDIETIISDNAEITRFDFDATGCPKQCN